MHTFIICGYGIPDDIRKDDNYKTYLHVAFNAIYERTADEEAAVIPCGGPTSCKPPYEGTEAEEIAAYLKTLMQRENVQEKTQEWTVIPEAKSLSTLENLLFAQEIVREQKVGGSVTVFCEKTREKRVKAIARHVFGNRDIDVVAIDFDTSKNRYLDPEVLREKEARAEKEALWTLASPERIGQHHELYEKKFAFLRQRQSEGVSHVDAVEEWFKNEREIIKELAPDHPLINQ